MPGMPKCEREMLANLSEALKPAREWGERAAQARRMRDKALAADTAITRAVYGGGSWEEAMVAAAEANREWTAAATKWLECGLHGKCGNPLEEGKRR